MHGGCTIPKEKGVQFMSQMYYLPLIFWLEFIIVIIYSKINHMWVEAQGFRRGEEGGDKEN